MKELDVLIVSIFKLLTRHSQSPNAGLEQAIADHMKMLANHPDCNSKVLVDGSRGFAMNWCQEARLKELGVDRQAISQRRGQRRKVH